jgi:hypothetical protein
VSFGKHAVSSGSSKTVTATVSLDAFIKPVGGVRHRATPAAPTGGAVSGQ